MDFSPDGKSIVYDNFARDGVSERDIFLLAADGSGERKLIESPAEDMFPVFAHDGKSIFFSSDRQGAPGLFRAGLEARDVSPLAGATGRLLLLGSTRDGAVYYATRTGGLNVYRTAIDLSEARLTEKPEAIGEGSSAVWSPDGKRIAVLARRSGENFGVDARFVLIAAPGQPARPLAPALAHIERIRWGKAGLVASASDGKARGGVFRIDDASGKATPLILDPAAPYQGYAADGVVHARGNTVLNGDETIHEFPSPPGLIALAPNGKSLAAVLNGKLVLAVSGAERMLPSSKPVTAIAWTPDSAALLTAQEDELWITPLTGEPRRVARAAAPLECLSLHPDGRQLLFTAGRPQTRVWVVHP
jgi:WD40 repeat protein